MNLDDLPKLLAARDTIGQALNTDQQLFLSKWYGQFTDYIKTPEGKAALGSFVDTWRSHPAYAGDQHALGPKLGAQQA